jgi:hypothetical protein
MSVISLVRLSRHDVIVIFGGFDMGVTNMYKVWHQLSPAAEPMRPAQLEWAQLTTKKFLTSVTLSPAENTSAGLSWTRLSWFLQGSAKLSASSAGAKMQLSWHSATQPSPAGGAQLRLRAGSAGWPRCSTSPLGIKYVPYSPLHSTLPQFVLHSWLMVLWASE